MRSKLALPLVLLGTFVFAACGSGSGAVTLLPTVLEFVQPVDGETIQVPAGTTPTTSVLIAVTEIPDAGGVLRLIVNDDEEDAQQRSADTEDTYQFSGVLLAEGTNTLRAEYVFGDRVPVVQEITVSLAFGSDPTDVPPPPAISFIEPVNGAVIGPAADLDGDLSNGIQIRVRAQTEDVTEGTNVALLVDTSNVGTAAVGADGVATFDSVTLGEGTRTLTVRTETEGGLAEATITVTVEFGGCEVTLLPAPLTEGCDVTAATEDLEPGEAGVSREFTVQTSCSSVTLTRNGDAVGTEAVTNGSATFTVALTEGENRLVAEASDAATGQSGTSGEQVYDVLAEAPTVALDASLQGAILPSDDLAPDDDGLTLLVFGESNADEGAEVSILADGEEIATAEVTAAGTFSVEVTFEEAGAVVLQALVSDRCENEGASAEQTLDIFLEAPPLLVTSPETGTVVGPAANEATEAGEFALTFTVQADGLDEGTDVTVECEDASGEFEERGAGTLAADGTATMLVSLEEGANACRASVLEPVVTRSPEVNVIVDTIAPEVEITAPADGTAFSEANQSVTATVTDADPSPDVSVVVTGGPDEEREYSPSVTDGSLTLTVELFQGQNTITVTVTDAGDNTGSDSIVVFLDAEPPVLTALVPTEGATLEAGDLASVTPLRLDATVNVVGFAGEAELCAEIQTVSSHTPVCRTIDTEGDTDAFNVPVRGGENTLRWTLTDRTGRVTTLDVTFTVDVDLPTLDITSPSDGLRTNDLSPIDVAVETDLAEGAEVALDLNGTEIATEAADADGNVVFSNVALQDNTVHVFMARGSDARGEGASQTVTVITDTTPPALAFTAPTDGALLGPNDGTVDGGELTVTASFDTDAEDGQTVTVTRNGDALGSFAVSNGEASGTIVLPEGSSTLVATVSDLAGNESDDTITVTVALTPPTLAFTAPADGASFNASDDADPSEAGFQVDATVSTDAADGTEVSFTVNGADAGTATVSGGTATLRLTLPQGAVTIGASVSDAVGNETTASVSVTVDSIPPTISITDPTDGATLGLVDGDPQATGLLYGVVVSTDAEDGQTVTLTDGDGNELGTLTVDGGEASGDVLLPEGSYTLTATVSDAAGNPASDSVDITVDITPPTLDFDAPTDGDVLNAASDEDATTPGLQTTVRLLTDAEDGQTVTLTDGDGNTIATLTVSGGEATGLVTLPEGTVELTASVSNAAGNETDVTITVIVDTEGPTLAFTAPTDGAVLLRANGTPNANGLAYAVSLTTDAEDGQEVVITSGGTELGTLTVSGGTASGTLTLPNGVEYTLSAEVEDAAGNSTAVEIEITVDTVQPELSFIDPADGSSTTESGPAGEAVVRTIDVQASNIDGRTVTLTSSLTGTAVADSFTATGAVQTVEVTLTPGTHELTMAATSTFGNPGVSGTITFVVDVAPAAPEVEVTVVDRLRGDIDVTWTQPGVSTIDFWELRRSTSPITNETQWNAATVVGSYPGGAGPVVEEFRDLDFQRTYYYAARATDTDARVSAIGADSGFVGFNSRSVSTGLTTHTAGAVLGDTNGNGHVDMAVGQLDTAVAIIFGAPDGETPAVQTLASPVASGNFATQIAGVGDVNGDGYADMLVSAPTAGNGGRAYLYFGGENGFDTVPSVEISLDEDFGFLGSGRVSGAGSLVEWQGRDYDDVVVGSISALSNRGVAFIIPGRDSWPTEMVLTYDADDNAGPESDPTGVITLYGNSPGESLTQHIGLLARLPLGADPSDEDVSLAMTSRRLATLPQGRVYAIGSDGLTSIDSNAVDLSDVAADFLDGRRTDGNFGTTGAGGGVLPAIEVGGPAWMYFADTAATGSSPGRYIELFAVDRTTGTIDSAALLQASVGTRILGDRVAATPSVRGASSPDVLTFARDSSTLADHRLVFFYNDAMETTRTAIWPVTQRVVRMGASFGAGGNAGGDFLFALINSDGSVNFLD